MSSAGALANQLGIPRAVVARNAAIYYAGGSDAETLSSRDGWSEGALSSGCPSGCQCHSHHHQFTAMLVEGAC